MSLLIEVLNLSPTSGTDFCRHSELLSTCQPRTTPKLMDKPKESTKSSNNISGVQSTTNKKIGSTSLPWWNLPTIIIYMPQLRFPHSLQTTGSTLVSAFPFRRFPLIRRLRCVPTCYKMSIVTSASSFVPLANSIKLTLTDITSQPPVLAWSSTTNLVAFRSTLPPTFRVEYECIMVVFTLSLGQSIFRLFV